jgi:5-methylcytosine-specific restriction endonuclease McrA
MRVISAADFTEDELNNALWDAIDTDEDLRIVYADRLTHKKPGGQRDCNPRPWQSEITTCYLCLQPLSDPVHMDHVLPKSIGGKDGLVMPVHGRCNILKGNRPLINPLPLAPLPAPLRA